MVQQDYLKKLVNKAIKNYEKFLDIMKQSKKEYSKDDEAHIAWIVFWLRDAYNLRNIENIKSYVDAKKEIFIQQKDIFECSKIEWYVVVMRIMEEDSAMEGMIQIFDTYIKTYESTIE